MKNACHEDGRPAAEKNIKAGIVPTANKAKLRAVLHQVGVRWDANLNEDEIKLLGLIVEQYLAFAEAMAQQRTPMYMNRAAEKN